MKIKCRLPKQYEGLSSISRPHLPRDKYITSIKEWASELEVTVMVTHVFFDYPVRTTWMVVEIEDKDLPLFTLKWGLEYTKYNDDTDRHDTC